MESSPEPQHILYLNRGQDDAITIHLLKSKDRFVPVYSVSHNAKMTRMEIKRIQCDTVSTQYRAAGAVRFRKIQPRVNVTVRGVTFKLTRKHPLSSTLSFRFLGVGDMRWEELDKKHQGMRLVDFNGKTLAHFRPRLRVAEAGGGGGGSPPAENTSRCLPGFELFAALADLDMDLLVTTGLAAAEYRRQLDGDWDMVAEEEPDKAGGG
ncbi:hypothetical protein EsH8_VII_000999 [Colletotrichum jinshuiense]